VKPGVPTHPPPEATRAGPSLSRSNVAPVRPPAAGRRNAQTLTMLDPAAPLRPVFASGRGWVATRCFRGGMVGCRGLPWGVAAARFTPGRGGRRGPTLRGHPGLHRRVGGRAKPVEVPGAAVRRVPHPQTPPYSPTYASRNRPSPSPSASAS
jgi:hypothetical protein